MRKRKTKQKKGNVSQTVIVNVAKSGARGARAPRAAPRANVVTYTDQTPLLNLVKEFTQNNRLMLEGSRDNITQPRLSIAPMNRLTTIDPSIGPAQRLSMNLLNPPTPMTFPPTLPQTLDPMNRSTTLDPMNRSSFGKLMPKRSRSVSPPRTPPKPTKGLATPRKNRASPPKPTKGLTRAPRSVNRYEI